MADLVAPIIPNGNESKGPELFAHTLGTGLAAMARFSEMKRQSEMDLLKLAEHERVSQEQNALEREKMVTEADIRRSALSSTMKVNDAHARLFDSQANYYANDKVRKTNAVLAFNQQREELVNDVNDQARKLNLDDPNFATKQPVHFAANVMQFEDMFALSPLPEVKNAIRRYRTLADQQKVPLKIGATFDQEKAAWVGGDTRQVPIWQIVRNMKDPTQAEATANALEASGHMKIIEDFEQISGTRKSGEKFSKRVPVTRSELLPNIKGAMDEGRDVKFQRSESRVPPAMLPKSAGPGTDGPTELPQTEPPPVDTNFEEPQASATPTFDATDTDKLLGQAKAAIAKGAAPAAVAARLQEMGIDGSTLWDAAA